MSDNTTIAAQCLKLAREARSGAVLAVDVYTTLEEAAAALDGQKPAGEAAWREFATAVHSAIINCNIENTTDEDTIGVLHDTALSLLVPPLQASPVVGKARQADHSEEPGLLTGGLLPDELALDEAIQAYGAYRAQNHDRMTWPSVPYDRVIRELRKLRVPLTGDAVLVGYIWPPDLERMHGPDRYVWGHLYTQARGIDLLPVYALAACEAANRERNSEVAK